MRLGFEVRGTFRGKGVDLVKAYPETSARCRGQWDGAIIAGEWRIKAADRHEIGPFEIWPEEDGRALQELFATDDQVLSLASTTAVNRANCSS